MLLDMPFLPADEIFPVLWQENKIEIKIKVDAKIAHFFKDLFMF